MEQKRFTCQLRNAALACHCAQWKLKGGGGEGVGSELTRCSAYRLHSQDFGTILVNLF